MSTDRKRSHDDLFAVLENKTNQLAHYKTLCRASLRGRLKLRVNTATATVLPAGLSLHQVLQQLDKTPVPAGRRLRAGLELIAPDGTAVQPFYTSIRKALYRLPCASSANAHVVIVRLRTAVSTGTPTDPFAALNELRALIYLRELLLDSGISPHVTLLLAHHTTPRYLYLAIPEASEGDLRTYLRVLRGQYALSPARFILVCEALLFQVLFTLVWLGRLAPHFHHNDLTLANVLIASEYPRLPSTLCYQLFTGQQYAIPNVGVRALLWDFDYASEPAVLPNVSALQSHYDLPSYGVHIAGSPGQDFYTLAWDLCTTFPEFKHTETGVRLLQAFGTNLFGDRLECRRAPPNAPSGFSLLSRVFGHWEVPGGLLGKPHYGLPPLQAVGLFTPANLTRIYTELPVQIYPADGTKRPLWYGGYVAPDAEALIPARLLYSNILVPGGSVLSEEHRVQFIDPWRQQTEAHLRALILEYQQDSDAPGARDEALHNSTTVLQQMVEFLGGIQPAFFNELATLVFFLDETATIPPRHLRYELLMEKMDSLDGHKVHALIFQYFWIRQLMAAHHH